MPRRRHSDLDAVVERESAQLAAITERLGKQLDRALRQLGDSTAPPDLDWVRAFRAYSMAVDGFVKSQERGDEPDVAPGAEQPLSSEEFDEAQDEIFSRRVAAMSEEQLSALLLEKLRAERGSES